VRVKLRASFPIGGGSSSARPAFAILLRKVAVGDDAASKRGRMPAGTACATSALGRCAARMKIAHDAAGPNREARATDGVLDDARFTVGVVPKPSLTSNDGNGGHSSAQPHRRRGARRFPPIGDPEPQHALGGVMDAGGGLRAVEAGP
jgi:hypothetical protein